MTTQQATVKAEQLRSWCAQVFEKCNVPPEDAALVAGLLIDTDLRGIDTHGIARAMGYFRSLRDGQTNPRPNITVIKEGPINALFDADNGLGYVASSRAMRWCIDNAKENGFAIAGVRNSTHNGAASNYAMMAAHEDLIGFAASNGPPNMAPPGSWELAHGNNPSCYAIPTGKEPMLVLDMANSVKAYNAIQRAKREGWKIPLGWALDKQGNPTENPNEHYSLVPFGENGFKGYGMSLVMDAMCGILTGSNFGTRFKLRSGTAWNAGHLFWALDPELFLPIDEFKAGVDETLRAAKNAPCKEGVNRIFVAGEVEADTYERRSREGIPLLPELRRQIEQVAQDMNVPLEI